jgi:hypothetical protein
VGRNEHKLGIRASSTCEVSFTDCVVEREAVLGGVGNGYKIAIGLLNEGRIGIAFQTVGLAQGAFKHAMEVRSTQPRRAGWKSLCPYFMPVVMNGRWMLERCFARCPSASHLIKSSLPVDSLFRALSPTRFDLQYMHTR